jgi:hypothetical protein
VTRAELAEQIMVTKNVALIGAFPLKPTFRWFDHGHDGTPFGVILQ